MKKYVFGALALLLALGLFLLALGVIEDTASAQGAAQLETALRQAAVACYAAEGIYPPDLAYLQTHYGVQVDSQRYVVDYRPIAGNLMPDITVLEREP